MTRLPTFLGIGAPKAATTWLHRCLSEHPEVFMPAVKETHFFTDRDPDATGLEEYLAYFETARPTTRAIGEFCTNYLASEKALERIATHLPDVKLIVSLRNPKEQVVSHYWHLRRQQFHGRAKPGLLPSAPSLTAALESHREALVTPALYAQHLAKWFSRFPRERFLVLLHDDIRQRPASVLREIFTFLEVDPGFNPTSLEKQGSDVRRGVSPRSQLAEALYGLTYRALNRHIYYPLKRAVGFGRADAIKEALRIRPLMERLFFEPGYRSPTKREAAVLQATFADEIRQLELLLGRDLPSWTELT